MKRMLYRVFRLGIRAAALTKREIEKEMALAVRFGFISRNDAKALAKMFIKEAKRESMKFAKLMKKEARRGISRARGAARRARKSARKPRLRRRR
jgi:hypothetical protein